MNISLFLLFFIFTNSLFAQDKIKILLILESKDSFTSTAESVILGIKEREKSFTKEEKKLYKIENLLISSNIKENYHLIQKTIEKVKPQLILGGITSNLSFLLRDIAEERHIPFITPLATNTMLTEDKRFHYTYRTCFNDEEQSQAIADFICAEKKKGSIDENIAAIYQETSSYSYYLYEEVKNKIKKKCLVHLQGYSLSSQKLNTKDISLLFLPLYQIDASELIKRTLLSHPSSKKITFLGSDGWAGGNLVFETIKKTKFNKEKINFFFIKHWSPLENTNNELKKSFLKLSKKEQIMSTPFFAGYKLISFVKNILHEKEESDIIKKIQYTKKEKPKIYFMKLDKERESLYAKL